MPFGHKESAPRRSKRASTIEDLEAQVHAEQQKAAEEEKTEGQTVFRKIFSWVSKMAGKAMDTSTELGLPAGVSLDDYKTIKCMYEKILDAKRGGKIVKGKDWMRIVEDNPEDKSFEEIWEDSSHGKSMDTRTDIVEFLLERYLPHAMADEMMGRQIRTFFLMDLGIIPYLA
ncbi:hypothetical protein IT413_05940 [Candidatus Peregrinibacteria bacterium]|nr:hypothetical protein [Candidatus Peregrinibacteria bacterium]